MDKKIVLKNKKIRDFLLNILKNIDKVLQKC